MGDLTDEEKCFKVLSPEEIHKLTSIYNDIDYDRAGKLDVSKSFKFNFFLEPKTQANILKRDAEEFIKECGMITAGEVTVEEWLFSFSKLYVVDQKAYNKFIEDYNEIVVATEGKTFTEVMMSKD